MSITCEQLDALLPDLFDRGLPPGDEVAAAEHLATCEHCRIVVTDLEHVGDLASRYARLELPIDARVRIRALLEP